MGLSGSRNMFHKRLLTGCLSCRKLKQLRRGHKEEKNRMGASFEVAEKIDEHTRHTIALLRAMQNPLQDYADVVGAPAFAYGIRYVYPEPEDYAIEAAIMALEERSRNRWIPVTERLPETRKYRTTFLATVSCEFWKNNKTLVVEWENTTVRGKDASRWIWNDRLFPKEWEIIAWQPLPAPYRPATDQDNSAGGWQEQMASTFLRDSRR